MTSTPPRCSAWRRCCAGLAPQLAGRVVLVFQPAEEALGGAAAMVADGVLEGVDMALGFHNQPDMPVGRFGYVRGGTLAAADRFDLVVRGRAAMRRIPNSAVDPDRRRRRLRRPMRRLW